MKNISFLCLLLLLPLAGCKTNTVSQKDSAPVTLDDVKPLDTEVITKEFATNIEPYAGKSPRHEPDPDYVLAEKLNDLEANAFKPTGLTLENAVVIPGIHDLWHRKKIEIHWIQQLYPKHRMIMHSILSKTAEGKWFDVVSASDKRDGSAITFYFDVTESITKEPVQPKETP